MKKGIVFVFSGPSGSGKTTLAESILKVPQLKDKVARSISFTTRPKRSKEKGGRDYFFIGPEEFFRQKHAKRILEWTKYLGYYYGTPKDFVDQQLGRGKSIILCLDNRGARRIKKLYPQDSITIFIKPPSLGILKERIIKRCRNTKEEEICRRLKMSEHELLAQREYDYRLVNSDLGEAIEKLKRLMVKIIDTKKR